MPIDLNGDHWTGTYSVCVKGHRWGMAIMLGKLVVYVSIYGLHVDWCDYWSTGE